MCNEPDVTYISISVSILGIFGILGILEKNFSLALRKV